MKRILIFCLIISAKTYGQPAASLRHIVDTTISKMQQYSLHRNEIDWTEFRVKVYKETKGISKLDKLLSKYPLFFQWINDSHSSVVTSDQLIEWKDSRAIREANQISDSAFTQGLLFRIERWGDVAYFRIPFMGNNTDEVREQTQRFADSLCRIDPASVKAWIIDLRLNTGKSELSMSASSASDQFYSILEQSCSPVNGKTFVAVLCGPKTSRSGETLLLRFKGRPNTIVIGEQTAGYVTTHNNFELDKDVNLSLATSYLKDRFGNPYTTGIIPDIEIRQGDDFLEPGKDLKVQHALSWFKMRGGQ